MHILYHVSFDPVQEFKLRIPKNRCPNEDNVTPRICFSERVNRAISSMPQGGQALRGMLKLKKKITPILHLYVCAEWEQPRLFLQPEQIKDKVGDAEGTREWWAIKVPELNHVMVQVLDAKLEDSKDKFGNTGVLVQSIDYDVIHELPKNAPEILLKDKRFSIRTMMSVVDEMKTKERSKCKMV